MLRRIIRDPVFWLQTVAVVLAGLLLACAFPLPPGVKALEGPSAAWLALMPVIIVARRQRCSAAFAFGWVGGLAFWLVALVWILQLRHTWGVLPVVVLGWIALAAYCALYTGAFAALVAAWFAWPTRARGALADPCAPTRWWREYLILPVLPLFWAGLETMRGLWFTGFPWNALGVSQARNTGLIQIAALGGTTLVSALIVLVNTALAQVVLSVAARFSGTGPRRRFHPEVILTLTAVASAWIWGNGEVYRIAQDKAVTGFISACVQPAIAQPRKWDDAAADDVYATLVRQSELAVVARPDLLIWPETAIPDLYRFDPYAHSLVRAIVTNGVPLLLGTMDMQVTATERYWFNSGMLIDTNGAINTVYHKRHLVPFGEYVPLARRLPLLERLAPLGFNCTPGDESVIFRLPVREREARPATTIPFAVLICFEDIMPAQARSAVRAGARVLVNLTNDAWFDGSSAAEQHMLHAVFRAVENRVPMIRATNTGLTGFIERTGRMTDVLWLPDRAQPVEGFAVNAVAVPETAPTNLYVRAGEWVFGFPTLGFALLAGLVAAVRGRRVRAMAPDGPQPDVST